MRMVRIVRNSGVIALAISLIGCASGAQKRGSSGLPGNDAPARTAGLAESEIADARKVYIAKCARCHKFYDPGAYDEKEWNSWMSKMSKKAHLKADQEQLLSRYLGSFRAGTR